MLTGQANEDAIERARREANLHYCLRKPWSEQELIEILESSLNNMWSNWSIDKLDLFRYWRKNDEKTSLKEQLKRHFGKEYDIEAVDNGEETLEIIEGLEKDNIDIPVVLCDQIMPGIKGDVLLQKIHTRLPKTLKILLTGQADAIAIGNAVNYANLYRYIAKPWEQMDLILTVSEATRSYFQDKQLEEQNAILQQINQELERFNATLERQVKERTAELEAQKIELRQKNAQLHELNASKDKLFSIISHDLRSPFQALLGYSQLIEETIETASKDEIVSDIKRLQKTIEQLYALLENLLTWSTIQRGIIKYHLEEVELDKVVESNLELFTPKAEQKQITLKNSITKGIISFMLTAIWSIPFCVIWFQML